MRITYSAQRSGFEPGRIYRNPRYFERAQADGASEVEIIGDWPNVAVAYEAAGVKVVVSAVQPEPEAEAPPADPLAALRAEAESLGLKADARWGEERLRKEVAEAKAKADAKPEGGPA